MFRLFRMFRTPSSLFYSIICPKLEQCQLPNCVFNHNLKKGVATAGSISKNVKTDLALPSLSSDLSSTLTNIINNTAAAASQDDLKFGSPKALPGVGAPAKYQQRMKYIIALIDAYRSHNTPQPKRKAVMEEYKVAIKSTNITYGANMTSLLRRARDNLQLAPISKNENDKLAKMQPDKQYEAVKALIHPMEKLERNAYTVRIPDCTNLADNFNSKTCDRCANTFDIDEILKDTKCQFHERKKRYDNTGRYWECCDQVVGDSQGCKTSSHHVFKAKDPYELQSLIPFKNTPMAQELDRKRIVGLDCEMGFTTKGLELIRLTVIDFYTSKVLFDEIIKPFGKVLDLNTTWSGVSAIPVNAMTMDDLHKVIFNSIIDAGTIIIGHGLENDLNALRLVHHNVVDTAILFPKGLDKKYNLKDLAFQMLDRKIQAGEHSSEEDSLAAIDIIKNHIISQ